LLLKKLVELYYKLDKQQFKLLLDIAREDIIFYSSIGTIYTDEKIIGVLDSAVEVIKRLREENAI
jgi:hypothetical protein